MVSSWLEVWLNLHPWRLIWEMRFGSDHFPFFSWVICRFHVDLPGCIQIIHTIFVSGVLWTTRVTSGQYCWIWGLLNPIWPCHLIKTFLNSGNTWKWGFCRFLTLQGTNISHILFPRWDVLVSWRVIVSYLYWTAIVTTWQHLPHLGSLNRIDVQQSLEQGFQPVQRKALNLNNPYSDKQKKKINI